MTVNYFIILGCVANLVFGSQVFAQGGIAFGSTSNTSISPTVKHNRKAHRQKKLLALFKTTPKNTLMGNKCFEAATHKLGFEYVVQPQGAPGRSTEAARWAHNFGVKVLLLLRHGPFWRLSLNKKRQACRQQLGDYMG